MGESLRAHNCVAAQQQYSRPSAHPRPRANFCSLVILGSGSYLLWPLIDSCHARLETSRALEIGCPAVWASRTYQGAPALGGVENLRPPPGFVEQSEQGMSANRKLEEQVKEQRSLKFGFSLVPVAYPSWMIVGKQSSFVSSSPRGRPRTCIYRQKHV